jgi:hypothetical protein
MDEAFDAIADELRREAAWEHRAEARDIVAAGDAARPLAAELRRIPAGEVVTVVAGDGCVLRGRVTVVGRDWLRVEEVPDALGAARARGSRTHDVALRALVRVTRDAR